MVDHSVVVAFSLVPNGADMDSTSESMQSSGMRQLGCALDCERIVESRFYSDSANDIPLLMAVSHPVAVNPDAKATCDSKAT